jgi:drug/metabolite transporter (DMT)-like permease
MKASSVCFLTAPLLVLAGMIWGLQMAISNDHSAFPAHAHLNLLGWVSLFLFGVYYRLNPRLDSGRAALWQVVAWCVGTVVLVVGVGMVHTRHESGDPIAAIGAIVVFCAMMFFTWLVYRVERSMVRATPARMAPAE